MSKANSNFDHLSRDKYGHKEIEGTYYAINKLEERIEKLENLIKDFMENWDLKFKRLGQDEMKFGMRWFVWFQYKINIGISNALYIFRNCCFGFIYAN